MTFQIPDYKRKNFLNLNNNNNLPTRPTYSKGNAWLKHFRHSNILCTYTAIAITNHALISKYHLGFFPKESFTSPYKDYLIELRNHILNSCRQFRKYWNHKRDSLKDIIAFLEFNLGVFSFYRGIT